MKSFRIINADVIEGLRSLPDGSVNCCVTSPPYWGLRDYGVPGQIGLERTPEEYTARLVEVFREVRRVLRDDGTLWLNLGDSYASSPGANNGNLAEYAKTQRGGGHRAGDMSTPLRGTPSGLKPKDLCGIPWRVAFALQADGWYLRSDIIWAKPNPMPESVTDRPTKAHEYLFLLAKSEKYHYDADAIREKTGTEMTVEEWEHRKASTTEEWYQRKDNPFTGRKSGKPDGGVSHPLGRNKRTVWTVATHPYSEAHFATFPPALIEPCILAGCPEGGTVLDPFNGSGTTGVVSLRADRNYIGIELNPAYVEMARRRITNDAPMFNTEVA